MQDAGNSDMPKRSYKVLPKLKGESSQLTEKRKKSYVEDAKVHSRNKSSIREIVKKEKKFVLALLSHLKKQKLRTQCMLSA